MPRLYLRSSAADELEALHPEIRDEVVAVLRDLAAQESPSLEAITGNGPLRFHFHSGTLVISQNSANARLVVEKIRVAAHTQSGPDGFAG